MNNEMAYASELLSRIREIVTRLGRQDMAAEHLGISPQYLSDVLHGRREISKNLAERLGYERVVVFYRK